MGKHKPRKLHSACTYYNDAFGFHAGIYRWNGWRWYIPTPSSADRFMRVYQTFPCPTVAPDVYTYMPEVKR